jgi:hypothetical protein
VSIVGIHLFCAGLIAYPSSLPEGVESSVTESTASEVVPWFGFEPIAIDADGSEPVTLVVQTDGLVTHLDLVLASGAVQQLDGLGNGLYSTEVRHEDALFGYAADDVNRNFVGFLDIYDGEVKLVRGNMFIDVYDAAIPEVAVSDPEPDIRLSRHIVNLHLPGVQPQQVSVQGVARRFYEVFPDHFDFINVVSIPSYFGNRYFSSVRNSVAGIGRAIQDYGSDYGSAERLKGYVRFPISTYFDLAERAYSHELGHNWINFLFHPKLQGVAPHWPISSLAPGIMGFQTPSNPQGLDFPFHISDQGDGSYLLVHRGQAPVTFNGLDLYLMGLVPPDQSGTYIVFENQQQAVCSGCILQGPVQEFSTQDVIEYEGARPGISRLSAGVSKRHDYRD